MIDAFTTGLGTSPATNIYSRRSNEKFEMFPDPIPCEEEGTLILTAVPVPSTSQP